MHRGTKILGMKPHRFLLTINLAACLVALALAALAQGTSSSQTSDTGIVLTKLSPPVYPPLARTARIMGDVRIRMGIRKDGSVGSAEVISGHPMLKQAALESAQKSTFECRACSEEVTPYSLTYTFGFRDDNDGPDCSVTRLRSSKCLYLWKCGRWRSAPLRAPKVRQSQGHITILEDPACINTAETNAVR
jgi:TonB family protein